MRTYVINTDNERATEKPGFVWTNLWVPAIVSIVVAACGIFVNIEQNRASASTTRETTREQISAAADELEREISQANSTYLREQRKQAYVALITTNRRLLIAEQDVLLADDEVLLPKERAASRRRKVRDAREEFLIADDVVKVVGSEDVRAAVRLLVADHYRLRARIRQMEKDRSKLGPKGVKSIYLSLTKQVTAHADLAAEAFRQNLSAVD